MGNLAVFLSLFIYSKKVGIDKTFSASYT